MEMLHNLLGFDRTRQSTDELKAWYMSKSQVGKDTKTKPRCRMVQDTTRLFTNSVKTPFSPCALGEGLLRA